MNVHLPEHLDLDTLLHGLGMDWGDESEMDDLLRVLMADGEEPTHVMSRQIQDTDDEIDALIRELVLEEGRVDILAEHVLGYAPQSHHKTMLQWQSQNREGLLLAWRGAAKCRTAEQRVLLADGRVVPIRELCERPQRIVSYDPVGHTLSDHAAVVEPNGKADVFALTLGDGIRHELTWNEPIYTQRGWVKACDVTTDDHILCLRQSPLFVDPTPLPGGDPFLLGLLVGDGSMTQSTPRLSCADLSIVERVRAIGAVRGFEVRQLPSKPIDWRLNGLHELFASYDLKGCTSFTKRVPVPVFQSPREQVAEYLAGYWEADGTADPKRAQLSFCSVSLDLLKDTKELCTRLERPAVGILSPECSVKGTRHTYYRLSFYGRDALNLWACINPHCVSTKASRIRDAWRRLYDGSPWIWSSTAHERYLSDLERGDGFAPVSKRVTEKTYGVPTCLVLETLALHGIPKNQVMEHFKSSPDTPMVGLSGQQAYFRPAVVFRIARFLEQRGDAEAAAAMRRHADPRYFWNKVQSSLCLGLKETYALTSPAHETYICEGAITHNSTYCTKARAILEILRDPNIRILITADAVDQSKGFLREIKWHFEKNEKLRRIFGDYSTGATTWSDTLITVNRRTASYSEPTITCAGIKTSLPSRHFDLILADDLVTLDNAKTEGERKRVKDYFYQTLYPTLEQPHGRLYVIGTRWHRDDLYGWLQENDYKNANLVLGALDETGEEPVSRWEEKFKTETLLRIKNASLEAFELQYMCRTGQGLGDIFNDKMFIIDDSVWPVDVHRWQGVDLATGQRAQNDPYAHVTLDMQRGSMLSYLQSWYKGQKQFPAQVEHVKNMFDNHPSTKGVVVEANAYQMALTQQVRKEFPHVPVLPHFTKVDKITRAQQLALFLIQRPCRVRSEHREFVQLMLGFPNVKGSKDIFDAFWLAHARARVGKRNRREIEVGLL